MAVMHEVSWSSREECLQEFARTFGCYPPRAPVPAWWDEFEKWYVQYPKGSTILRTEGFTHEDEDEG